MLFSVDLPTALSVGLPAGGAIMFIIRGLMAIQIRLAVIESQIAPLVGAGGLMVKAMGSLIHQPHPDHARQDELLDKFIEHRAAMSIDELKEFQQKLEAEYVQVEANKDPRIAAYALYIGWVKQEIEDRINPPHAILGGVFKRVCRALTLCA